MDDSHKVEYKVRDLGTRSVTLFPTSAQIKREIKDVPLRPGRNEISIVGLSPTIDKNSVTVEGSGSATITGISVEFLPNREIFDEVYPDSDSDDPDSDDDDDDNDSEDQPEQPGLMEVKMKLVELRDDLQRAKEAIASADDRIKILDDYSKSLDKREGVVISDVLDTYKQEREKAYNDRTAGLLQERAISEAGYKVSKEYTRLLNLDQKLKKQASKAKAKVQKAKAKKKQKLDRRLAEQRKEKERIRNERARCWPKYCYTAHIQLEVNPSFTPSSSRRSSISSDIDVVKRSPSRTVAVEETPMCDLLLSYVTNSAFWTPSYDLQLSTVNASGTLCFDAGLHNTTSESWENCKITLSTSQATSSSLDDSIPILMPWRIKLAAKGSPTQNSDIFNSREERQQQGGWRAKKGGAPAPKRRQEQFGLDPAAKSTSQQDYQMQLMLLEQQNKKRLMMARQEQDWAPPAPQPFQNPQSTPEAANAQMPQQAAMRHQQQQMMQMQQQQQAAQARAQMQMQMPQQQMQQQQMQQQQIQMQMPQQQWQQPQGLPGASALQDFDFDSFLHAEEEDDVTMTDAQPSLEFQNSLVEETGFTTTYDLPGLKTLVPKFTPSKQRVARIHFSNVVFSHTVVAKYQPAAYLKAKLRNSSKLTLLRGPASLTLDGSFMGQTKIPRCSSGEAFSLSLGVDSSIRIMYPKPDVQRSTSGMFSKEDSSVSPFQRMIGCESTY
ncbi:hypothetical protein NM208_g13517 [Fusarium decemcellulare]|uniref:Uncharacterized protein n=1 Tax=Fusarium decemcellulare TaxID=57161 RepID=A0ACC1RJK2_9HYPO|nr:hypothetical protein NM208_g13517 [Fusarium decemcellulare]